MTLTDAERAEFIALTKDSYDDLWTEEDLPFLRKTRAECVREQALERHGIHLVERPRLTDDDEDIDPNPRLPERWTRTS